MSSLLRSAPLLILLSLLLSSPLSRGEEKEFRAIQLMDGRVVKGEVRTVEKEGILLKTRDEEVFIPFVNIQEIRTITEGEYLGYIRPRIAILNFTSPLDYGREALYLTELFLNQLKQIPTIETLSYRDFYNMLPVEDKIDFEKCSLNAKCLGEAGKKVNVEKILIGDYIPEGESRRLHLSLISPHAGRIVKRINLRFTQLPGSFDPFFKTPLYNLLDISYAGTLEEKGERGERPGVWVVEKGDEEEPAEKEPEGAEGELVAGPAAAEEAPETLAPEAGSLPKEEVSIPVPRRTRYSKDVLIGVGFLPIPGIAPFLERDYLSFALNWFTVLASTTALVYGSGYISPDFSSHMVSSGIGFYLINVSLNQVFTHFLRRDRKLSKIREVTPYFVKGKGGSGGFGLRFGIDF